MLARVLMSRDADRDLERVPLHIRNKLIAWVHLVEDKGLRMARLIPGFHDELLKGDRKGQRSIRLSIHYRAIYTVADDGAIDVVTVEEVTKHDY